MFALCELHTVLRGQDVIRALPTSPSGIRNSTVDDFSQRGHKDDHSICICLSEDHASHGTKPNKT